MHFAISVRSSLAGLVLFTSVIAAFAQAQSEIDLSQDPRREWSSLAQGRTEFEISDPALVPSRLALAAKQAGCRYQDQIGQAPLQFVKVKSRRLAIVACFGIPDTQMVFDLSNLQRPRVLEFPVLAPAGGFGTTASPGRITWNKEAGTFQTQISSDLLPTIRLRYAYRFNDTYEIDSPFVIERAEAQWTPGPDEWTPIWEAKPWSFPARPK